MLWRYSTLQPWQRFFPWMNYAWHFLFISIAAETYLFYGKYKFVVTIIPAVIAYLLAVTHNGILIGKAADFYKSLGVKAIDMETETETPLHLHPL